MALFFIFWRVVMGKLLREIGGVFFETENVSSFIDIEDLDGQLVALFNGKGPIPRVVPVAKIESLKSEDGVTEWDRVILQSAQEAAEQFPEYARVSCEF